MPSARCSSIIEYVPIHLGIIHDRITPHCFHSIDRDLSWLPHRKLSQAILVLVCVIGFPLVSQTMKGEADDPYRADPFLE
jgi:hypothetical protein